MAGEDGANAIEDIKGDGRASDRDGEIRTMLESIKRTFLHRSLFFVMLIAVLDGDFLIQRGKFC